MEHQSLAARVATGVARRDPGQLSALLTTTVRLRALLPAGPIEAQGRENVASLLCALVADFDTVEVVALAGEAVGDRLLVHYRLRLGQGAIRWVCTQTAVCTPADGRIKVINLLCSGFREIEDDGDLRSTSAA